MKYLIHEEVVQTQPQLASGIREGAIPRQLGHSKVKSMESKLDGRLTEQGLQDDGVAKAERHL